ncbi:CBS domain-containing protein [Sulfolobus tengchongensis]|uniref:CBS domain-containing protein n=1 Tax=Sulfolobus tengchongensis TaxID=207809 RepID=A0AAX4KZA2_9CREN
MSLRINGSDIISLDPNAYVVDALYFMRRNNVRRLVVSNVNGIIGVFTIENAIKQIMENKLEVKLGELKLRKPVFVENNNIKDIVRAMVNENSDFVIYNKRIIITEKDVVRNFDWNSIKENVKNISKEAIVVFPYTKISTCIEAMLKNSIRHLPVVSDIPLGIISARDIAYSYDTITINTNAEKIMNVNLVSVGEESELVDIVRLMNERSVGSVLIKTGLKNKVKIITNRDLIKLIFNYIS